MGRINVPIDLTSLAHVMPDHVFNLFVIFFFLNKLFHMNSGFPVYLGKQADVGSLGACPHLEAKSQTGQGPSLVPPAASVMLPLLTPTQRSPVAATCHLTGVCCVPGLCSQVPWALTLWPPVQRAGRGVKAPCHRGGRRRSPGWGVRSALPGAHALDTIGEAVLSRKRCCMGGARGAEPGGRYPCDRTSGFPTWRRELD